MNPEAARSMAWVCGRSLAGIWFQFHRGMDIYRLWLLCAVRYRSLRRADHSSRGTPPTVVCLMSVITKPRKGRPCPYSGRSAARGREGMNNPDSNLEPEWVCFLHIDLRKFKITSHTSAFMQTIFVVIQLPTLRESLPVPSSRASSLYRRFGKPIGSICKGKSVEQRCLTLKIGQIGCPETSVTTTRHYVTTPKSEDLQQCSQ